MVALDYNTPVSYDVFAEGRPVDVEIANDGSLQVSDGRANAVLSDNLPGVSRSR